MSVGILRNALTNADALASPPQTGVGAIRGCFFLPSQLMSMSSQVWEQLMNKRTVDVERTGNL